VATELERLTAALVGRYRVERELGRGGMATVYLADDLRHERKVALKVLKPELAAVVGAERFLAEIKTTAHLQHPHILPLFDSGEADSFLFYVMPYVEGESLRELLDREHQLPVDDAVRTATAVANALDYAHRHGVIHRDIKPANILLHDGEPVVADFGIALAVGAAGGDRLTETGLSLGTPHYVSPEQAAGDQTVGPATDTYALGCVLFEMLVGDPPFPGTSAQAILTRKVTEPAPSVRTVRPTVPEAVERALQRALTTAPSDRFRTTQEFAAALTAPVAPARVGRRRVIAGAVALGAVLAAGAWWVAAERDAPGPIERLAVLPLANLMNDPEQEYFVEGMHDALISELAQIGALTVISRQSVLRYRGSEKSLPEIARELGVDAVVEGSVFRAGDTVRITAQLLRALPAERHLWAGSYEKDLRDVLALYTEVAQAIASEINVTVTGAEQARLASARPVDPEAYTLYLKANYELGRQTEPAFRQAIEYYQEAIGIDSSYAPAYAGLAVTYINLGSWTASLPPGAVYSEARAAALEAIERDSTLAEAHIALGRVKQLFEWDWAGADAEFRRGIALNPTATYAQAIFANYLMSMGRFEEAVAFSRQAVERDPLLAGPHSGLGWALERLERDGEALEHLQRALELAPDQAAPRLRLAEFYLRRGRLDEAYRYAAQAESDLGAVLSPTWLSLFGFVYGKANHKADALRVLNVIEARAEKEYVPPNAFAGLYLGLDQKEKALDFLERGYETRDVTSVWHKMRWIWDPLRDEPRFQRILELMNFPEG
jgi:eukaryotic-like serine/threonine-protein kinase